MIDPPLLPDPVAHLENFLRSGKPRLLIGLAGLPGSGKSTFAAALTAEVSAKFGAQTMVALAMDGFHLTKADLKLFPNPNEALLRRGAPWTFDPRGLADRLKQLKLGSRQRSVRWPDFQHGVGDPVPDVFVVEPSVKIVLVEGLYLLYDDGDWAVARAQFDERWFLDTPSELSNERLIARHMVTRNISREESVRRIELNDRLNANLTLQTKTHADWRVQ